jgi:hypothetical protein
MVFRWFYYLLLFGYLKAVWPDFVGCMLEVWPAPGAQEACQNVGGETPHILEGLPGPPGPAELSQPRGLLLGEMRGGWFHRAPYQPGATPKIFPVTGLVPARCDTQNRALYQPGWFHRALYQPGATPKIFPVTPYGRGAQ